MPIERQSEQWPHRREAMLRAAIDHSQPRFVDESRNPSFYHPTEFTTRNQFSPNAFNPPADSKARPIIRWTPAEPEQDTLNLNLPSHFSSDPSFGQHDLDKVLPYWSDDHIYPIDRQPQKLYRSINLDMNHPDMHPVRRALFGNDDIGSSWNPHRHESAPGLFPASEAPIRRDVRGFNNTDLAPVILDHLNANEHRQGLGTHWTNKPDVAKNEFGNSGYSNNVSVMLSADWLGHGEDPYRTDTGGDYPEEHELTLMPGAPLRITDMHLQHPHTLNWHSIFDTSNPQKHTAAMLRTAMPWTPDEAKAIRQDKNHPHYWDVPHDPQGLPVNTPDEKENPNPEYLHRGIRVKGPVGRSQIQQILQGGIGQHFTSDIHNAAAFGDPSNHDEGNDYPGAANYPGPKNVGLIFTIKHPGQQHIAVNPDGESVNADYWDDEHEHTLSPGAPVQVTHIHMKDSGGDWRPLTLPIDTRGHTAALNDDENEEDEEEFDGNYCSKCGPDDPDWCEDCEECKIHDNHENHCSSCGPNDSDWCSSCELCDACDVHDNHCSSCGPNDSDWCEECEQCKNCDYHDNHCVNCGPGDSDWCEYHEECKNCDGHSDRDAFPLHLRTPLMREHERPMVYNDGTGEHEYYFSPKEINPASEAASRPYMDFPEDEDEDPTLDFGKPLRESNGIDSIPAGTPGAELYRGLTVDLRHPDLAQLRRAIYGGDMESYYSGDSNSNKLYHQKDKYSPKEPVQPGMFPGPYSDKELAAPPAHPDQLHQHLNSLLDHMENFQKETGLGRHWSTDFSQAMGFSNHNSLWAHDHGRLPVRMTARWRGQGENPYRHETGEDTPGDYSHEQEMNLLPGAPVELHDVEIFHPKTKKWHSLMDDPQRRTAGLFL
jgi:hypothetical protein